MATNPPSAPLQRRVNRRRSVATSVAAVAIALTAVAALGVGAVHGARQVAAADGSGQVAAWHRNTAYWDCLDIQAHSLVGPNQAVWLDAPNFPALVTLEKVVGPWAEVATVRSRAQVELEIVDRAGPGTCLGAVVVGRFDGRRGRWTVVRTGAGAAVPGNASQLPSTPL